MEEILISPPGRSACIPVWSLLASTAMITILLGGCTSQQATLQYGIDGPDHNVIWPMPPETPRIRYTGQIESQYSIGFEHSFWSRLKTTLLGIEPTGVVTVYRPFDAHVDSEGAVYVTDGSRPSIQIFEPDKREAREIIPEGSGALAKPMGIAGDDQGHLYVADPVQRRIVALDVNGEFVKAYGGRSMLLNPVDVAVSQSTGYVYVVDSYLHQVLIFNRNGSLVKKIGRDAGNLAKKDERRDASQGLDNALRDSEPADLVENRSKAQGAFHFPAFVEVGPDNTVYVSDGMNFRIQAFTGQGEFLFQFGSHGDTPGSFARPKDLATDSEGNIYIVDAAFNNVQIFNPEGTLLLAFGSIGAGPGEMYLPIGMTIDSRDRIYVADRYNNRLQIFQYLSQDREAEAPLTD